MRDRIDLGVGRADIDVEAVLDRPKDPPEPNVLRVLAVGDDRLVSPNEGDQSNPLVIGLASGGRPGHGLPAYATSGARPSRPRNVPESDPVGLPSIRRFPAMPLARKLRRRTPRFSIVLFTKNGMPFVREAIASLAAQAFDDYEVVIQDAASTDGTAESGRPSPPRRRASDPSPTAGSATPTTVRSRAAVARSSARSMPTI